MSSLVLLPKFCGNENTKWYIWKALVLFLSLFQEMLLKRLYDRLKKMYS